MCPSAKSPEEFESITKRLTTLCQKQVNFWHGLAALTDNEIAAIKKVGKLAILSRDKTTIEFISLLGKGNPIPLDKTAINFRKILQPRCPLSGCTDLVSTIACFSFCAGDFSPGGHQPNHFLYLLCHSVSTVLRWLTGRPRSVGVVVVVCRSL
jgi:hypothetical protein